MRSLHAYGFIAVSVTHHSGLPVTCLSGSYRVLIDWIEIKNYSGDSSYSCWKIRKLGQ